MCLGGVYGVLERDHAEDSKPPFPQGDGGNELVLPHWTCDRDLATGLTMNVWLGYRGSSL